MLGGDPESLAGRFEFIRVPHWSLAEMRAAFGITLDEYVEFGGPGSPAGGLRGSRGVPGLRDQGGAVFAPVRNHPQPDGKKRCAFLATVEFVERNGRTWIHAPGDPDETDHVIRGIAGGEMSEAAFRDWIAQRIG